jgi:hypothetical protein
MLQYENSKKIILRSSNDRSMYSILVVDPGKGVCADPVNGSTILGKGGTDPQRWEQRASVEPGQGKG